MHASLRDRGFVVFATASVGVIALATGIAVLALSSSNGRSILATGTTDHIGWTLSAYYSDGQLCMAMKGGAGGEYTSECGFGPPSSDLSGPENASDFPNGVSIEYGPAPSDALTVTLSPESAEPECGRPTDGKTVTRALRAFPPSLGSPGKWFAIPYRAKCAVAVTFRSAQGNVVPPESF